MSNAVNPRIDMVFKRIFGVEENKDLTLSLINSIVSLEDQVSEITLLNPYNPKNFANDKLSILDIKAKAKDGKRFNIEIQVSDEADYDKRALYYWARLYAEQLKSGQDYGKLSKAIGIHILNFTSLPDAKRYHNAFHLKEKKDNFHHFSDLEIHTIELNKFDASLPKELSEFVVKLKTSLDIWSSFLTRNNLLDADTLPPEINKPELKKALGILEQINFTDEERNAYEDRLKWLRIEMNTLKKQFNDGMAAGEAKGKAEGQTEKSIEIAKKMLSDGLEFPIIKKYTGLCDEEILDLEDV